MGMFFTMAWTVIKKLVKAAFFCGLAWFLLPLAVWGIGEAITGAPMTEGTPLNTVSSKINELNIFKQKNMNEQKTDKVNEMAIMSAALRHV